MKERGLKLFSAIENNQYDLVEQLLKEGGHKTALLTEGFFAAPITCLHYAARSRNIKIVDLLLEYDAELVMDSRGCPTIEGMAYEAKGSDWSRPRELELWRWISIIAKRKKTDQIDAAHYGVALLYAVIDDKYDIARALLEAGASPNKWENSKEKCLDHAIYHKNYKLILLLLKYGAHVSERSINFAAKSLDKRCNEIFKQFSENVEAISDACQGNDIKKVKQLIDQGTPVLIYDKNLLTLAVQGKNKDMLSYSLQEMLDVPLKISKINEAITYLIPGDDGGCQAILLSELFGLQSQLPREKAYLLHHAIRYNLPRKVEEIMDNMECLDEKTILDKILTKEPKVDKYPLQLALEFPSECTDIFVNRLIPLLIKLAKNPKLNSTKEFKEICFRMFETLFAHDPVNLDSEEVKANRIMALTLHAFAGDKANAKLKLYSYQALVAGKGLISSGYSIEELFLQDNFKQTLQEKGGMVQNLQEFSATNSAATNELAQLYFWMGDYTNCIYYLELAHQQSSNDQAVVTLAKQLIQRIFLTKNQVNGNIQSIFESGKQEVLINFLRCQYLDPVMISNLSKEPAGVDDDELLVLTKISRRQKMIDKSLLAREYFDPTLETEESCKLIDFYRYAIQVTKDMSYDCCDAIMLFKEMPQKHRDRFLNLCENSTTKGIHYLIQDAIEYGQIDLIKGVCDKRVKIGNDDKLKLFKFAIKQNEPSLALEILKHEKETCEGATATLNLLIKLSVAFITQSQNRQEVYEFVQGLKALALDKKSYLDISELARDKIISLKFNLAEERLSQDMEKNLQAFMDEQVQKTTYQGLFGSPANNRDNLINNPGLYEFVIIEDSGHDTNEKPPTGSYKSL